MKTFKLLALAVTFGIAAAVVGCSGSSGTTTKSVTTQK